MFSSCLFPPIHTPPWTKYFSICHCLVDIQHLPPAFSTTTETEPWVAREILVEPANPQNKAWKSRRQPSQQMLSFPVARTGCALHFTASPRSSTHSRRNSYDKEAGGKKKKKKPVLSLPNLGRFACITSIFAVGSCKLDRGYLAPEVL